MSDKPSSKPQVSQEKQTRWKKTAENKQQLSSYEQEELAWTQDDRLGKFYNQATTGLHDEIIQQSVTQKTSAAPSAYSSSYTSHVEPPVPANYAESQSYSAPPPANYKSQKQDTKPSSGGFFSNLFGRRSSNTPAPPSPAYSSSYISNDEDYSYSTSGSSTTPSQPVVYEPSSTTTKANSTTPSDTVYLDTHGNPVGAEFDLAQDGAFKGFKIVMGNFVPVGLSNPINALTRKGFTVVDCQNEASFLKELATADVAWIISGTDPSPKVKTATSSGESYPAWKTSKKEDFVAQVVDFHSNGGGLYIWGDNDPLFEHANAILPQIFDNPKVQLIGNTPGGKQLSPGESNVKGQFGRHVITSGIVCLYEGVTICHPADNGPLKVLATSTDGNPAILYADNEVMSENQGRVVVDCGYTKNYISWDSAGAARYIVNATVWLVALEYKLKMEKSIEPRQMQKKQ